MFTADPIADATLKQGDMVAYTLIMQTDADGEQMLRIQIPAGVTLSENAFVYRPQSMEDEGYSVIWGSDGCVLMLPRLTRGDMLMFVARVVDAADTTLACSVTWAEQVLTISHRFETPPVETEQKPTTPPEPEASPQNVTTLENVETEAPHLDEPSGSIERRQTIALLICAMLLPVSSMGFLLVIRQCRQYSIESKTKNNKTEEELL